ncbi:hypothetical protein BDA99DRAFT_556260 [Phascolomyces articulosus]|uniref:Uncharacterized protein n=1 Tax=Phascolomyces articulosus TaxID=60185 RepID=A0AAD5K781_9FUNG|nr:hypothetical protein BDA99DRAFT_556260 [Phascolomyces articulosus]
MLLCIILVHLFLCLFLFQTVSPKFSAATSATLSAISTSEKAVCQTIHDLSDKFTQKFKQLHQRLDMIKEKVELIGMGIQKLYQLNNMASNSDIERLNEDYSVGWIMAPVNEDDSEAKLNDNSVIDFIPDYNNLFDKTKEDKLKKDI